MRSILIQIDPKQTRRDELPIDPANAKEIERQAKAWGGIHTPIEVWIADREKLELVFSDPQRYANDPSLEFLIMDGFHRTNVAVDMGMQLIGALLYDCTESEFWDKRIAQAKKHHVVEDDRLHIWMQQSWEREFAQARTDDFSEAVFAIHQALAGSKKIRSPEGQVKRIQSWFQTKANMWGRKPLDVARVVLEKERIISPKFPEAAAIAEDAGLTAEQTAKLTEQFPQGSKPFGRGLNQAEMKQYAADVVAKNENLSPDEWRERRRQDAELSRQRQAAFYETPAGVEEKRKRRIENGVEAVNGLRIVEHRIHDLVSTDIDELLLARPDVLGKIKGFLSKVNELTEKLKLGEVFKLPDSEVIELRAKVARLENELSATRRKAPVAVNPEMLAYSSHEIEINAH